MLNLDSIIEAGHGSQSKFRDTSGYPCGEEAVKTVQAIPVRCPLASASSGGVIAAGSPSLVGEYSG